MKLYIAAHSQPDANMVATLLREARHTITATWLTEDFSRTANYTEADREAIALKNADEVAASEGLVLLASPYRVPGGKFVEVGVALGLCLPVFVLGHRENMLIWHPLTRQFNSAEDLAKFLEAGAP